MIRELKLMNIEISDGEKNIVGNGQGKILKILFNPSTGNHGVRLRIFTREGEMILNVTQGGLYYPRSNVSSEKREDYAFSREGDEKDYYYFNGGLLFSITANENFEGIVIDKLVLMYQDSNLGGQDAQKKMMLSLMGILQEIVRQNQRDDGRG